MTVQELYNILEKEVDAGNINTNAEVYLEYNGNYLPFNGKYHIVFNLLALHTE